MKKRNKTMNETITKIICPHCRREIPLDEVLTHQIKEKIQQEFNDELNKREKEIKLKEEAVIKKEGELKKLKEEQAREIEKIQDKFEKDFAAKLSAEKKKTEESIRKKILEETAGEMKILQEELSEKTGKIKEFKNLELQLRQDKRKLEEEKQNLELEVTRKLDAAREKLKEEIEKRLNERHRFKYIQKEKLIEAMKNQIEYAEGALIEDNVNNNTDNNFVFGNGTAYGIEFFINKKYQREGDIHVWKDDHIEWNKAKELIIEEKCEIINEENYLMYKPKEGLEIYEKYSKLTNDTKLIVIKK